MRIPVFLVTLFSLAGICSAQPSLPGCEARPEVRQILREKLRSEDLDKLKYTDRVARQHEVLDGLIAEYPRELEPYRRLINFVHYETGDYPALQARYREQAKQHADDPLALYLAGSVLFHTDTPESLRLLEDAKAKAPDFAWPNLQLADVYSSGKRVDKKRSAQYLAAFFSACPGSTDRRAHWLLTMVGDSALQARVAADLRKRLTPETDLEELKQYETLWGLEFRARAASGTCRGPPAGFRRFEASGVGQLETGLRVDGFVEERLQAERRFRGDAHRAGRSDLEGFPFVRNRLHSCL